MYYKAFQMDLTCKGLQFEIGKVTMVDGPLQMCRNGLHCCKNILSCLSYYTRLSRFCEVTIVGDSITDGDKTVCQGLLICRELTGDELCIALTGNIIRNIGRSRVKGKPRESISYVNGKRDGPYLRWSMLGKRTETIYSDGVVTKFDKLCD